MLMRGVKREASFTAWPLARASSCAAERVRKSGEGVPRARSPLPPEGGTRFGQPTPVPLRLIAISTTDLQAFSVLDHPGRSAFAFTPRTASPASPSRSAEPCTRTPEQLRLAPIVRRLSDARHFCPVALRPLRARRIAIDRPNVPDGNAPTAN